MIQPARFGMGRANYRVVGEDAGKVVLEDLGPWDRHPTVTNDAEQVVADMAGRLRGRRLLYYDSDGELTELRHDGARFLGFAFGGQRGKREGEDGVQY